MLTRSRLAKPHLITHKNGTEGIQVSPKISVHLSTCVFSLHISLDVCMHEYVCVYMYASER